ncbi:hypothetical protein EJ06DRAFT_415729 [Trichodelitschia bisporula]|uniref:DH domain-containing protein n=1 Tax=Trichodelitschia bisporula TaxID=703511 RepID=A0A6G1HYG8_9PEZI|nr:hypothetical protein EJ06DRAFT_415729 [Trichodelitschia bisporula]
MEVISSSHLVRTANDMPGRVHPANGSVSLMGNPQGSSTAHFSSYSQSSSIRSSNTTQLTSSSTLFSPPPPLPTPSVPSPSQTPANGAPVQSNNVLNKRADKESSLYQKCVHLRRRLRGVPGFEQALQTVEVAAEGDTDPVTLLWRTFRQGYPLLLIWNALERPPRLELDMKRKEGKREQQAVMQFMNTCLRELQLSSDECFFVTDLYGNDTTGIVKVITVINRILDILVQEGRLDPTLGDAEVAEPVVQGKRTQRQHIVDEIVKTERTYVQHLEMLQRFRNKAEEKGLVGGDVIHSIFLNLNTLLDFQRRFLIRVEQINAMPEDQQDWGGLFVLYKDAFFVYESYIANTKKCEEIALAHFEVLKKMEGEEELRQMVESPSVFSSFLLKPFQRLSKYPLLLKELRDKGNLSEELKMRIDAGIEAASAVLQRTNEAVDEEERVLAVAELRDRVEDWKGHKLDSFGNLLLYGTFSVIKGETGSSKDPEREYRIYLFQMILLCCKELNPAKQKAKAAGKDKRGPTRLQLKGRIFMQNVTDVVMQSKPGTSYTCQIYWKGDPSIESFTIRFTSEETMKKWARQVDAQRRDFREQARISNAKQGSAIDFPWMKDQPHMPNPYAEQDDDEDDADTNALLSHDYSATQSGEYGSGWNSSTNSLQMRSRSATNESLGPMGANRVPPRQFPMGAQAPVLAVRTQTPGSYQQVAAIGPNEQIMDSYFSPTAESPLSTRSSGQLSNGMFPFPRQPVPPMPNGWNTDDQNRYTAPAMPRQGSRDGPLNGYPAAGRNAMQRPSLPPNPSQSSLAQNRLRSASSPDIQNPGAARRIADPSQPGVPDLPPFPTHYAYSPAILNRAANNSPSQLMGPPPNAPVRSATQSPGVQLQRERLGSRGMSSQLHQEYSAGGPAAHMPPMPRAVTDRPEMRAVTPASSLDARLMTPNPYDPRGLAPPNMTPMVSDPDLGIPTQLKVKVHCPAAGSSMTLVIPTNISYQLLKDRIDAKLQRSTNMSLSSGHVKLKYLDEEDYVNIQSDEDVQMAFENWKEQHSGVGGQIGEIELFVQ